MDCPDVASLQYSISLHLCDQPCHGYKLPSREPDYAQLHPAQLLEPGHGNQLHGHGCCRDIRLLYRSDLAGWGCIRAIEYRWTLCCASISGCPVNPQRYGS
jgi:hypothetical protein